MERALENNSMCLHNFSLEVRRRAAKGGPFVGAHPLAACVENGGGA